MASKQMAAGRAFLFEHPASATSWSLPSITEVASVEGVSKSTFDQCVFGLVSPASADGQCKPIRKRTTFLSNAKLC
eukprot:10612941-Alexandrium_andersonii.AAC.1